MAFRRALTLLSVAGLAVMACTGPGATSTPTQTTAPTATAAATTAAPTATATEAPTATATATASPAADACAVEGLEYKTPGRLTLSTDLPAFPPWWGGASATQYPNEPEGGSPWSESDFSAEPYSMEGFEGSTAYAIAEAMGFTADQVDWVENLVFETAFAPGPKPFDVHFAQVAILPERAEAVDFSDPYFDSNQAIIALSSNPITSATSIADLRSYQLGAAQNTTSFDFLENTIQPTVEPRNYPSNDLAVAALKAGGADGLDGLIVDLSTSFYMRDAQIDDFATDEPEGKIVGQFGPPAEPDHVGAVLELDSTLTDCVNQAIAQLWEDGSQQARIDQWIDTGQSVPFLE
jgi:polar amino acid transport system substrate-binding protein